MTATLPAALSSDASLSCGAKIFSSCQAGWSSLTLRRQGQDALRSKYRTDPEGHHGRHLSGRVGQSHPADARASSSATQSKVADCGAHRLARHPPITSSACSTAQARDEEARSPRTPPGHGQVVCRRRPLPVRSSCSQQPRLHLGPDAEAPARKGRPYQQNAGPQPSSKSAFATGPRSADAFESQPLQGISKADDARHHAFKAAHRRPGCTRVPLSHCVTLMRSTSPAPWHLQISCRALSRQAPMPGCSRTPSQADAALCRQRPNGMHQESRRRTGSIGSQVSPTPEARLAPWPQGAGLAETASWGTRNVATSRPDPRQPPLDRKRPSVSQPAPHGRSSASQCAAISLLSGRITTTDASATRSSIEARRRWPPRCSAPEALPGFVCRRIKGRSHFVGQQHCVTPPAGRKASMGSGR